MYNHIINILRLCWDPVGIGDRRHPGRPRRDIRSRKSGDSATDERMMAADHRSGRLDPTDRQLPTLPIYQHKSNTQVSIT